jgi:hypothetical protein
LLAFILTKALEWEENKAEVIAWVQAQKAAFLRRAKARVVANRTEKWLIPLYTDFMTSALLPVYPTLLEIGLVEEVRSAIEDTPLDEDPSAEATQVALAKISEFVDSWRQKHDAALVGLVQRVPIFKNLEITQETLLNANTTFECELCRAKGLMYPHVLAHPCNLQPLKRFSYFSNKHYAWTPSYWEKEEKQDVGTQSQKEVPGSYVKKLLGHIRPLSTGHLRFSEACYHHILQLLQVLGLPHDTTSRFLNSMAPRVECHCTCYHHYRSSAVPVVTWPKLVSPTMTVSLTHP